MQLRNNITRNLEGSDVLYDSNPGITVVNYRGVGFAWFNSVEGRGLITSEGLRQFGDALEDLELSLDGIVLTDNLPEQSAVSMYGVDIIREFVPAFEDVAKGDGQKMANLLRAGQEVVEMIYTYDKPVVGLARKLVLGGGFELMLATRSIVQSSKASYWLPECGLDVPAFVKERYAVEMHLPGLKEGKVLFPGWFGHFLLYNKVWRNCDERDANEIVDRVTFDCERIESVRAVECGLADTYLSEALLFEAAVHYAKHSNPLHRNLDPSLLVPRALSRGHSSPGAEAAQRMLMYYRGPLATFSDVGERTVEYMLGAMRKGLGC